MMDRHPSTRGERETLCVEAFCQGADLVLDGIDPTELLGHQLANVDEPKAWISDRNYWLLRDIDAENPLYENVLGRLEFYRVLQNEVRMGLVFLAIIATNTIQRFREGPSGEMIGPIRNL